MASQERIRCAHRYLRIRLMVELGFVLLISGCIALVSILAAAVAAALLSGIVFLALQVRKTYRFTVQPNFIRTQKLFTQHIDVTTPINQIQGVSVHQGILEALLDVGSLEISTASSHGNHAVFIWPHLAASQQVANTIQEMLNAPKHK